MFSNDVFKHSLSRTCEYSTDGVQVNRVMLCAADEYCEKNKANAQIGSC